jgi:Ras-related protein Rab-6A
MEADNDNSFIKIDENTTNDDIDDILKDVSNQVIVQPKPKVIKKRQMDVNITIVGDIATGKTTLIKRYLNMPLPPLRQYNSTIIMDYYKRTLDYDENTSINISIWDTSGNHNNVNVVANTLSKSDGFIVVYDITNKKSFEDTLIWVKTISEYILYPNKYRKDDTKVPIFIVGNKSDERDKIKEFAIGVNQIEEQFHDYAKSNSSSNIDCIFGSECCALYDIEGCTPISDVFNHLTAYIVETKFKKIFK